MRWQARSLVIPHRQFLLVKAAVNAGADMDIDIGKNIELGYMAACFGTPDQIEGFASFKEKRASKVPLTICVIE
ncbi:MAG: hypothetical protein ACLUD2_21785 [Clostridium sp.]